MYENINVHVGDPARKVEIQEAAVQHKMSVSGFMLWCYEQIKERESNGEARRAVRRKIDA